MNTALAPPVGVSKRERYDYNLWGKRSFWCGSVLALLEIGMNLHVSVPLLHVSEGSPYHRQLYSQEALQLPEFLSRVVALRVSQEFCLIFSPWMLNGLFLILFMPDESDHVALVKNLRVTDAVLSDNIGPILCGAGLVLCSLAKHGWLAGTAWTLRERLASLSLYPAECASTEPGFGQANSKATSLRLFCWFRLVICVWNVLTSSAIIVELSEASKIPTALIQPFRPVRLEIASTKAVTRPRSANMTRLIPPQDYPVDWKKRGNQSMN